MPTYFIGTTTKQDDGWFQMSTGNSSIDGEDYVLTTNYLRGDQVPGVMNDAKTCAEFVAGLLNAHYSGVDVREWPDEKICAIGQRQPDNTRQPVGTPELPF